jgi:acyl-coenzyme A synthetase/AMP-(fatty) acid ligase
MSRRSHTWASPCVLVPGLYDALLRDMRGPVQDSALRYCLTMGEAVTQQLSAIIEQSLGARVYSAYGMSEALSGLGHHGDNLPFGCCGQLLFGEARLVDCDPHGADARRGDEGELWVRNATVAPCYRDENLNAEKFVDGWYRTGDRFRRDAQGRYFFLGRVDAMCVVNGRNVYPADVEQVLLAHPAVRDCLAAIIVLDDGRRRLGALVCPRAGSTVTAAGLLDWFLQHGSLHAMPAWLAFADSIPDSAGGKRDRRAVAAVLQRDYAARLRRVS